MFRRPDPDVFFKKADVLKEYKGSYGVYYSPVWIRHPPTNLFLNLNTCTP